MDGSFYAQGPLELFVASKAESSLATTTSSAVLQPSQEPFVNLFQDEESVDISALVEACGKSSPKYKGSASGGSISSAGFIEGSEAAFPFDTLLNPLNMYGTENSLGNSTSTDLSHSMSFSMPPQTAVVTIDSLECASSPAPGKAPRKGRGGSQRKKHLDRNSVEYREKRDRNNIAVRKSRNKSKLRIQETEMRVKELEDENSQLQNRITLLTKELNVLKSLFTSAGVPQPGPELDIGKKSASE